ncbi:MAG: homoserine dehydrogenase [Pseudomonadota bacterium]|nr:homoserine dehydrogenase [Pseudomonadota bacterium]
MTNELRIGVAGLGTVGCGLLRLLNANGALIAQRAGRPLRVTAVSARDRARDRGVDLSGVRWVDDAAALASADDVDVVCELIGGSEGTARALVEASLAAGKPVVTANKALLAEHGAALSALAERHGVPLAFEAAVAGGIPIIKALKEGLAGNTIERVYGILNGTCNYILTEMRSTGRDFDDVLAEAQALGYAEADPTFDVDGIDAAHKLALLSAIAFGTTVDFASVRIEGIRNISSVDIAYADEFGFRIKLLGIAERAGADVSQRVQPVLVRSGAPIAKVDGVNNAVVAEGNFVGRTLFEGPGAGAGPTASAVAGDIIDIASGRHSPVFGVPSAALTAAGTGGPAEAHGRFYIRLKVADRAGVIADLAAVLRDNDVSIESLLQRGEPSGGTAPIVLICHDCPEHRVVAALAGIQALDTVLEPPHLLCIKDL